MANTNRNPDRERERIARRWSIGYGLIPRDQWTEDERRSYRPRGGCDCGAEWRKAAGYCDRCGREFPPAPEVRR